MVVAGFSLVIYFWAKFTRLPREEMLEIVGEQSGVKDVPPRDPVAANSTHREDPAPARSGVLCASRVKHGTVTLAQDSCRRRRIGQ